MMGLVLAGYLHTHHCGYSTNKLGSRQLNICYSSMLTGEYITIYQYQRQQQKLRLQEKEQQLQALSSDREILKNKLGQLQGLVKKFISQKNHNSSSLKEYLGEQDLGSSGPSSQVSTPRAGDSKPNGRTTDVVESEVAEEATEIVANGDSEEVYHRLVLPESEKSAPKQVLISTSGQEVTSSSSSPTPNSDNNNTANKILALISEIGSNQILSDEGDFHPWFWEHPQGRLMTV